MNHRSTSRSHPGVDIMSLKLCRRNLASLPPTIGLPGYEAADLTAGIIHFGVGNFHRAHQGSYLDRLFSQGLSRDWAIVGAGVMPNDERLRDILIQQDYLTLVIAQSADGREAHVTAPMIDFLPIGDQAAIVARLSDPAIRIVSLTVTEGGYFLNADGEFDAAHPAIRADAEAPDEPQTVFGLILKGLKTRRANHVAPFTVMSCDNLPHNGSLTRRTVTGLARLADPALADWVDAHVSFPNGMVDRITPATSDRERRIAREDYGVDDAWPVFSEDFIQWVLEDDFPQGRPDLEAVGVTFVQDVTPYEEMKLRILNASHAMIAYPAALMSIQFAHEAVTHPLIAPMLGRIQRTEVIPGVTPVPEMTPTRYFDIVRTRFSNPDIADTIERLCYDGGNRQPKFIVPAIGHALRQALPIEGLALASALWCRYCAGTRDDGTPIPANDPQWDRLNATALLARATPSLWLDQHDIYGAVGQEPRFQAAFAAALDALYRDGVPATLKAFGEVG